MQQSCPILRPCSELRACGIATVLHEEPCQIHMTRVGRLMQWGRPVIAPGQCSAR